MLCGFTVSPTWAYVRVTGGSLFPSCLSLFSVALIVYLRLDDLLRRSLFWLMALETQSSRSGAGVCLASGASCTWWEVEGREEKGAGFPQ